MTFPCKILIEIDQALVAVDSLLGFKNPVRFSIDLVGNGHFHFLYQHCGRHIPQEK